MMAVAVAVGSAAAPRPTWTGTEAASRNPPRLFSHPVDELLSRKHQVQKADSTMLNENTTGLKFKSKPYPPPLHALSLESLIFISHTPVLSDRPLCIFFNPTNL
jgi:hypothetical protein